MLNDIDKESIITKKEIIDSIKEGVKEAFYNSMVGMIFSIDESIEKGVYNAFLKIATNSTDKPYNNFYEMNKQRMENSKKSIKEND